MSRQVIISDPRNEIHTPFKPNSFANRTAQTTIATAPRDTEPEIAVFALSNAKDQHIKDDRNDRG